MNQLVEVEVNEAAANHVYRQIADMFSGEQTVETATGIISFLALTIVDTALRTDNPYAAAIEIRDSWTEVLHEYIDRALDHHEISRPS